MAGLQGGLKKVTDNTKYVISEISPYRVEPRSPYDMRSSAMHRDDQARRAADFYGSGQNLHNGSKAPFDTRPAPAQPETPPDSPETKNAAREAIAQAAHALMAAGQGQAAAWITERAAWRQALEDYAGPYKPENKTAYRGVYDALALTVSTTPLDAFDMGDHLPAHAKSAFYGLMAARALHAGFPKGMDGADKNAKAWLASAWPVFDAFITKDPDNFLDRGALAVGLHAFGWPVPRDVVDKTILNPVYGHKVRFDKLLKDADLMALCADDPRAYASIILRHIGGKAPPPLEDKLPAPAQAQAGQPRSALRRDAAQTRSWFERPGDRAENPVQNRRRQKE